LETAVADQEIVAAQREILGVAGADGPVLEMQFVNPAPARFSKKVE
jgi:hypothetical protein